MPDLDLAYPLRFDPLTGDLAQVVIGSGVEKGQCVQHIADTPTGAEKARPWFGRPELAYGQGEKGQLEAALALKAAIDSQEPRARGQYDIEVDDAVGHVGELTVDVRALADDTTDGAPE